MHNLLFLMTDHQRADSLGMVQAGVEVCPNLNHLASRSTLFNRAYNTCPLCAPARTALATGKYPTRNGIVYNDWRGVRAGDHKPIHQCLDEAGYDVAHIGVDHIRVNPTLRERVSFSRWISNSEYSRYLKQQGIDEGPTEGGDAFRRAIHENQDGNRVLVGYSNTRCAVWDAPAEHFKDSYFCQQAVDFLSEPRTRPFALFVYLWAPHPPLRVPEPYASLFDPAQIAMPANVGEIASGEPENRRRGIAGQLAEAISMDEWRRVWAAHLGLTRLADDGIGNVLEALNLSGHADDTITVFTSDHGDHLGQHRMYQKMEMYEQAIRVPLIVHVPGTKPSSVAQPVSHLDLMPTLLDLTGLESPADLDGISLRDAILEGELPPERSVHSEYSGNPTLGDIRRAVITQQYKYVYDPDDRPELYDLEADPLEMQNLAGDATYASVQQRLHRQCKEWAKAHGDWIKF